MTDFDTRDDVGAIFLQGEAQTRPDAWSIPGTGQEWCNCGEDHVLTREDVHQRYVDAGAANGRVPHPVVVQVTEALWGYTKVCRFFDLALEDAARAVVGRVQVDYEEAEAVDITGTFSKTWQGCPEEACRS